MGPCPHQSQSLRQDCPSCSVSLPQRRLGWCLAPALVALAVAALWALAQANEARLTFSGTWALDGATLWARLMIVALWLVLLAMALIAGSPFNLVMGAATVMMALIVWLIGKPWWI